jgi:dolichol-phosphate mannosyltransferase
MTEAQPKTLMSRATLSVIIPCFNEERSLATCVARVLEVKADDTALEIIIVDDCSTDGSAAVAANLAFQHPEVRLLRHERNRGKGAALRTGFREATGDFVAVQDADLEYNPVELRGMLEPLRNRRADVVLGSRFKGQGPHRVLYFWHYLGNAFLTLLSNLFTDLNLTDMEVCYKVFRREVIQSITIEEDRFGFEPEIVAKIAHRHLRIYEMAVSYEGRTYEEGKKITWKDGLRALYCIFRYNSDHLPTPIRFMIYLFIGCIAATANLLCFLTLLATGVSVTISAAAAFILAAVVNYFLCISLLFRHKARWSSAVEVLTYALIVAVTGFLDVTITRILITVGMWLWLAKSLASIFGLIFNYLGRRHIVF